MSSYLDAFWSYFMPDLVLPEWLQVFVGIVLLTLFSKVIIAVCGVANLWKK